MSNSHLRSNDVSLLHPTVRDAVAKIQAVLDEENIPLKVFEAYRTPERQADLYAQGRTKPGGIVTYAKPWSSYHNYGLAVDFVAFVDGQWSWDTSGDKAGWWQRMHEVGKQFGLMPLNFETPHLQLGGTSSSALYDGLYPDGGDSPWADNLAASIAEWDGDPAAAQPPDTVDRPPLENGDA